MRPVVFLLLFFSIFLGGSGRLGAVGSSSSSPTSAEGGGALPLPCTIALIFLAWSHLWRRWRSRRSRSYASLSGASLLLRGLSEPPPPIKITLMGTWEGVWGLRRGSSGSGDRPELQRKEVKMKLVFAGGGSRSRGFTLPTFPGVPTGPRSLPHRQGNVFSTNTQMGLFTFLMMAHRPRCCSRTLKTQFYRLTF